MKTILSYSSQTINDRRVSQLKVNTFEGNNKYIWRSIDQQSFQEKHQAAKFFGKATDSKMGDYNVSAELSREFENL